MEEKMSLEEKLLNIQSEIVSPKGKRNEFANFNYRTVDDILKVAIPICKKYKVLLYTNDDLENVGERFYIVSSAFLKDIESGKSIVVKGYAREPEHKTKMDDAQVTGTSSTYARKRALEALLALCSEKDIDSMDNTKQGDKGVKKADRETLEKYYANYRTELNQLGIDFREEKANEYICSSAKTKTQDNQSLKDLEMKRLLRVYKDILDKKKNGEVLIFESTETF